VFLFQLKVLASVADSPCAPAHWVIGSGSSLVVMPPLPSCYSSLPIPRPAPLSPCALTENGAFWRRDLFWT
jgi:hypothetical protein